jgi:CheY-like chemotaxis protein
MAKLLSRTLGTRIEISLALALDVWPIFVDPVQLEAALTNLATNARDAMPKGGRLSIATANRSFGERQGAVDQDLVPGEYAMLQVSDTGCGMPPNILSQIFEPFFTTKGGQGTGLGLSMVFGLLKQSGGHINAYSEVGLGTTFRLYLPRDPMDATGDDTVVAEPALHRGGGETVLVVEDVDPLRRLVVRQMDQLGYRTIEAADAAAALKVLDTGERVDLVFSDIVMGGEIDGLELARVVSTEWPHIKIVLTSGFPAGADPGGKQSRVDGFALLSKPYRAADLATALREALQAD